MPNASQSSVQEAIAAIIEQEQKEGTVLPEYIFQRNRVWIERNLNKHLEPVFAEVAERIGLDKNKLGEAVARHEQEVTQYLKEQEPETDKNFAALTKTYRQAVANRKAALEDVITTKPSIAPPPSVLLVLDKPDNIVGSPPDFVVGNHIHRWNSSAKCVATMVEAIEVRRVRFFFSWYNDSDESVVITGANSSLTARGKCSLHVDPGFIEYAFSHLMLRGWLSIHLLGTTTIVGETTWIEDLQAHADGNIVGGTAHTDTHHVFKTVNVSCLQEILVPRRQPILFAVEFHAQTACFNGDVKIEFDKDDPFVHCPVLTAAFREPLISFSESLNADSAGWEGYCLVQRIEPVRLSRGGTQVKLTLRASSVGSASIDRIYISQADPTGEPFDSAGDLTAVTSAPIVIPAGTEVILPAVNYRLDRTKPLLIAVDFSAAPASAIRGNGGVPPEQASAYYKLGAEAANADRAGFTAYSGLYLVERIEAF